jgi:hypothetical protein
MSFKVLILALFVGAPPLLPAADSPVVEARIKLISTTRPLVGVGIARGKKAEGIVIPTDMFSEEIVYRGPARFELFELNAVAKPTEPKPATSEKEDPSVKTRPARGIKAREPSHEFVLSGRPPLAWIDLPANQGRLNLILLVTPGKGNGITALNDAPGSFPPGSNRYFNLCGFPVVVKTPSGEQAILPGGTKVIRPGAKDNEYYDLQLVTKADSADRLAFSSRIFHLESIRKLYLFIQAPGDNSRLIVRDIEDRPPSAKGQTLSPIGPKGGK